MPASGTCNWFTAQAISVAGSLGSACTRANQAVPETDGDISNDAL